MTCEITCAIDRVSRTQVEWANIINRELGKHDHRVGFIPKCFLQHN